MGETPAEAMELREAASPASLDADGNVKIHVIRPGIGKGRGRHLYEAEMLEENAHKFAGWKMYVDHLSPEARKRAGGLPRSTRDLGGRIVETTWDPDVPADEVKGYGRGAVVATARPTPFIRELIENDPEIIEASISATATGVRPVDRNGQRVWLVEGINDKGSVDWVTEAGAGGRVVSIMESVWDDEAEASERAIFESFSDDELDAALRRERPELVESISTAPEDEPAGDATPPPVEEPEGDLVEGDTEGDEMGELTPEVIQEALQSEEVQETIDQIVQVRLRQLVEATLAEERDLIHEEARANAGRQLQLRDLRDQATQQIEESRLPDAWKAEAKAKFGLDEEGSPTRDLDVVDQVNEEGETEKSATQVLRESVEAEINHRRTLLAAAYPTRVTGQGPSGKDGEDSDESSLKGTLTGSLLSEAGFEDPDQVYAGL